MRVSPLPPPDILLFLLVKKLLLLGWKGAFCLCPCTETFKRLLTLISVVVVATFVYIDRFKWCGEREKDSFQALSVTFTPKPVSPIYCFWKPTVLPFVSVATLLQKKSVTKVNENLKKIVALLTHNIVSSKWFIWLMTNNELIHCFFKIQFYLIHEKDDNAT